MRDRQNCIDCDKQSPETETNYTLISAQFGWRLSRRRADNGDFIVEWRCPDCWRAHKQKMDDAAGATTETKGKTVPERPRHPAPRPAAGVPAGARSSRPPASAPRPSSKPPSSAVPRPKRG